MSDEDLEVDLSPIYFTFQIKEITAQKTNTGGHEPEAKRQKQGSLEYASKAWRSHDLKQETDLDQSLEGLDEVFEWRPPIKPKTTINIKHLFRDPCHQANSEVPRQN